MAEFFIVGTPIGNLDEITFRAVDILKKVDVIYCEDTRRTIKLLNAYEIKKPLKSCPAFREKKLLPEILKRLSDGENIAYASDAGMPGLSDPGAVLVHGVREAGVKVEVIGGTSSLTHFIAGLGVELSSFSFVGFLPARQIDREKFFAREFLEMTIFFESPHRLESTLAIIESKRPELRLAFAKELSKISEQYFFGTVSEIKKKISSFKGEWIGAILPMEEI